MVLERQPPHQIVNLMLTITLKYEVDCFVGKLTFQNYQ
jgi:hypothetical protein